MAERITDHNIAGHRRLVVRTIVAALQSVFNDNYNRERQLVDLKITSNYPLVQVDYPCIVVEYQPQRVVNAGVGHEEWFPDASMIMRKWHHRRFEGTLNFEICGLSPLDRDILSDALTEVISFGRLDAQLTNFFDTIYGSLNDPVKLMFSQLMLNIDEIDFGGDSASVAPWAPEDTLVYQSTCTIHIHGGFYNVIPDEEWGYVTRAKAEAYPQGEVNVVLPFPDPSTPWSNPLEYVDADTVTSSAAPTGEPHDEGTVTGSAVLSGSDSDG